MGSERKAIVVQQHSTDIEAMAAFYGAMKSQPVAAQDAALTWLWARFKADRLPPSPITVAR